MCKLHKTKHKEKEKLGKKKEKKTSFQERNRIITAAGISSDHSSKTELSEIFKVFDESKNNLGFYFQLNYP